MLHRCSYVGALVVAASLCAQVGYAQDAQAATRRDTIGKPVADSKAGALASPESHAVQVCIDCHGWGRVGDMPAMIIKDATYRVVWMVAPSDTGAARDTTGDVEPAWIAKIDIVKPAEAVAALGRGFENGILVVVLTPAGSEAWRLRRSQRPTTRVAP
jgi:hypothetical protein